MAPWRLGMLARSQVERSSLLWPWNLGKAIVFCLWQRSSILTTIGVLEEPLGNARLHGARLIAALLHTNTAAVNQELCRLNTLGLLLVSHGLGGKPSWGEVCLPSSFAPVGQR